MGGGKEGLPRLDNLFGLYKMSVDLAVPNNFPYILHKAENLPSFCRSHEMMNGVAIDSRMLSKRITIIDLYLVKIDNI